MNLIHTAITESKPWVKERGLSYLMNAHRLDFETSGVMLLAKSKPILITLANAFGAGQPVKTYVALVQGLPAEDKFEVNAKLAPHPAKPGLIRVDSRHGKRSQTLFEVLEKFRNYTLLQCRPVTGRTHQIRVHLKHIKLTVVADDLYGGSLLLLSRLKSGYRLKPNRTEKPLMARVALHAAELKIKHPVTGAEVSISAPWPKDLTVAVK